MGSSHVEFSDIDTDIENLTCQNPTTVSCILVILRPNFIVSSSLEEQAFTCSSVCSKALTHMSSSHFSVLTIVPSQLLRSLEKYHTRSPSKLTAQVMG